jgi:hypothetical protein
MKMRSDKSGQVMLATAFLLAIVLTFIALMLNNVVYYNNISYMGFMNQGYDDISIKNLVAQEAFYAYSEFHDDQYSFNVHMQDLANSLNNVTLPEGSYVVISSPSIYAAWDPTSTYQSTEFELTIYSKGLNKTYSIKTYHSLPAPTPIPTPGPTTLNCKVTISSPSNNSIVYQGGTNHTYITITAINLSDNSPASNQEVHLKHYTSMGKLCFNEDGSSVVDDLTNPAITDSTGTIRLYWFPLTGVSAEGTDVINASIGMNPSRAAQNLSNNVMIVNKVFVSCDHIVTIGSPTQIPGNGGSKDKINGNWYYYVMISIPITVPAGQTPDYNFSSFSVGTVFNTVGSVNVDSSKVTPGTSGNFTEPGYVTGPGAYSRSINVKLYLVNKNLPFTANLTAVVTAYCNVHYLPNSGTSTSIISGAWS